MGYQVQAGNRKHISIRPPGGAGNIRLDSLGDGYGEADIRARIKGAWQRPLQSAKRKMYRVRRMPMQRKPLPYFQRLCLYYMYLLRGPRRARNISPALRREMLKLERYQVQFRYLRENRIETRQQLTMLRDALQGEMDAHTEQRRQLYLARRRSWRQSLRGAEPS